MEIAQYLPVFHQMTPAQQQILNNALITKTVPKGTILHNGSADCAGLVLVEEGQLRAYSLSDEGREVTLYRLLDRDICLFSASCVMQSVQFEVIIQAEKDTRVHIIPPHIYKRVVEESAPLANYINALLASRFSEVMWLMEQVMWKSMDKRLAAFLVEESRLEDASVLKLTHEMIANHLGTAREVVTRMLRYFQSEGMVRLTRGTVELTDMDALEAMTDA